MEKLATLPAVTQDIGEMLSTAVSQDRTENRKCLLKILCALQFWPNKDVLLEGTMMRVETFTSYFLCSLGKIKR